LPPLGNRPWATEDESGIEQVAVQALRESDTDAWED
jgi:hypothetical protein